MTRALYCGILASWMLLGTGAGLGAGRGVDDTGSSPRTGTISGWYRGVRRSSTTS